MSVPRVPSPVRMLRTAYIDPGNIESDLQAGSKYGYMLLWVLLFSTAMGIVLQYLSAKLAIVSGTSRRRAAMNILRA